MLKVENVSKTYSGKKVLNNLSFTVPEGEIYTLVGAFGEGKTALINMIIGFEKVDEGNILVKGTNCQLSPERAKKVYGYVPALFPSYPTMTLKEYMRFFGRMMDTSDDEKIRHLTVNLLGFVGLGEYIDKRISKLNRGQKQKLSIARALLHNPKLIIIDEPFYGLDVDTVHDIKEILDFLHKQGRTIFMTSENLQLAASISTSIGIIEHGTMINEEKSMQAYEELMTSSIQLQNTGYIDSDEVRRQLQHTGYLDQEEISRQLSDTAYIDREEVSRQLSNTAYIDREEVSRQLSNTAYIDREEVSRKLYEEDKEESLSDLTDLGIEDDFSENIGYGYVNNITEQNYTQEELSQDYSINLDYLDDLDYTKSIREYEENQEIYNDFREITKMPYEQVEAIEKTRRNGEDINQRVYSDIEPMDDMNSRGTYNDCGNKDANIPKKKSNKRGIVEKRGVGGSRVVTDKNNYRNKKNN